MKFWDVWFILRTLSFLLLATVVPGMLVWMTIESETPTTAAVPVWTAAALLFLHAIEMYIKSFVNRIELCKLERAQQEAT